MKKARRITAMVMALAMMTSVMMIATGCQKNDQPAAESQAAVVSNAAPASSEVSSQAELTPDTELKDDGKELTIYGWNEEFKNMLNNYYLKDHPLPAGVKLNFIINPNDKGVYQQKLDLALENKESIDMYLIEADYAKKYTNTENCVTMSSLGITADDMKDQYKYTQDVVKDETGAIKGSSWQATPGLFMYKRSLAKKYLGTDDPAKVQEMVSDWDKFIATAEKVNTASKGATKLLPGVNDIWQVVRTSRKAPWVQDDKLAIDDNVKWFMDLAKKCTDEKLTAQADQWSEVWNAGMGKNDAIMGYFFSTWGIQWSMVQNCGAWDPKANNGAGGIDKSKLANSSYGDWAAVNGPQAYYWGGTWMAVPPTCDNKSIVADIIKYFTTNKDSMKNYCEKSYDYVNNKTAIQEIIDKGYSFDFLGGQDHYSLFQAGIDKVDTSAMSGYDQTINDCLYEQTKEYANGKKDYDTALKDFKAAVADKFSELTVE